MKGLKDFRRSLNKDRTSGASRYASASTSQSGSNHNAFNQPGAAPNSFQGVKNALSIQPPKMVIKALRDHKPRSAQELSFQKGDFFHVISDSNSTSTDQDWFEASNPITGARGLVPANHFEILGRNVKQNPTSSTSPILTSPGGNASPSGLNGTSNTPAMPAKVGGGLYAEVKYDFAAERPDELDAKAGDPIIVIAQSNFEWFVAKPIGKLGGPGLIPVSFVEMKDLKTGVPLEGVQELISTGVVPKVEEWKKMTADYKKNTIPLGRLDSSSQGVVNSPFAQQGSFNQQAGGQSTSNGMGGGGGGARGFGGPGPAPLPTPPPKDDFGSDFMDTSSTSSMQQQQEGAEGFPPGMPPGEPLPVGIISSSTVDSFHFEQGDYWFRIQATHIASLLSLPPSLRPTRTSIPVAPEGEQRDLILYRLYEDFYEFQIALLDNFPNEAGREKDENGNNSERILPLMPGPLTDVNDLITAQRRTDLDTYIVDLCNLPEYIMRSELVRLFFEPRPGDHCTTHPQNPQDARIAEQNAIAKAERMEVEEQDRRNRGFGNSKNAGNDEAQDYEDGNDEDRNHERVESNGLSKYSEEAPVGPGANLEGLVDRARGMSISSSRNGDPNNRSSQPNSDRDSHSNSQTRSNSRSSGPNPSAYLQPHSSMTRKHSATSTLDSRDSRGSGSVQTNSSPIVGPPPSQPPPFIKIKIFHRTSDDLVAIRVPPTVTLAQLLEKVRERLGNDISVLRYRENSADTQGGNAMMRVSDDEDLKEWFASGAKLVLYADSK